MEITPGPNMAYLAIVSASEGRLKGYAVTVGVALGLLIIGIISAIGVGAVISESRILYEGLRFSGIAYMLWLAWENWRQEQGEIEPEDDIKGLFKYFKRGLITNILNPKAAIFYIAVLPNFIIPVGAPMFQISILTVIFVVIATLIHVLIVTMSGTLKPFLIDPKRRLLARRFFAILLVGVAIWIAVSTGKDF